MRWQLLILALALNVVNCFSQIVKRWGLEEGITSDVVYAAMQDSRGYIWLATENGVSRFDGKRFKNFTSNDGLPDNDIFVLKEDALGRMWMSCFNGQPCYIFQNKIYTAKNDSSLKKLVFENHVRLHSFHKKLIIAREDQCYEIDEQGKINPIPAKGPLLMPFGKYLLAPSPFSGYYLYDYNHKILDSIDLFKEGMPFEITPYAVKNDYFIFTYGKDNYPRYKVVNNKIVFVDSIPKNEAYATLFLDGKNRLWGNIYGIGLIPLKDDLTPDRSRDTLFHGMKIWNFAVDREGNYWGCTPGDGLYLIPNNDFLYYDQNNSGFNQNDITELEAFGNEVYLGFNNSDVIRLNDRKFYNNSRNLPASVRKKVTSLYIDSTNVISGGGDGLLIINKKDPQLKKNYFDNIKCIIKSDDHILFGKHNGTFRFSLTTENVDTLFTKRTTSIFERKNGEVLIGTLSGLYICKKKNNGAWSSEKILYPENLQNARISSITEVEGIMVIGTAQKGLIFLKDKDHEFVKLGDGLNEINCKNIFVDKDHSLWVATYSGLFNIKLGKNIHDYSTQKFGKFNGLLSDIINDVTIVNDTIYVAGPEGLTIFARKRWAETKNDAPAVYVSDMFVNGVTYYDNNQIIQLPIDSNTIEFYLSGIDFKSLGNVVFKYRLVGANKNWQQSSNNFVRFESLPPGNYTFEVMAMNAKNVWSKTPATITLIIIPNWWQTIWFRVAILLLFVAVIYFIVRLFLSREYRRH
jgi:hypothetical protein